MEKCNKKNWEEKEKYWISYYDNLTNHTDGGEGGSGKKYNITYDDTKKIIKELNTIIS